MTSRRPNLMLLSALLAAALSFTGCASTDMASAPTNAAALAGATPELSTFTKLIKQAGLESTLQGAGPITVFAPTDEAFKAVPAATLDKLAKDPEQLKQLLNYHVVPGLLKAADIDGTRQVVTLSGAKLTLAKAGDFVTVDEGLATKADIASGNGVVHIIDRVLTPPKK